MMTLLDWLGEATSGRSGKRRRPEDKRLPSFARSIPAMLSFSAILAIAPFEVSRAAPTVINFDSIALAPGACTDASNYLASYAITLVPTTSGASGIICSQSTGGEFTPTSAPNVFFWVPSVTNTNVSVDLLFSIPLTQISFTRPAINPATSVPAWDAYAYDASNKLLSSASEPAQFPGPPAKTFTLAGAGITRLHLDAFNSAARTVNSPPIDNLTLVAGSASATRITYYMSGTIASGSFGALTLSKTPAEFTVVSDTGNGNVQSVMGAPTDPPLQFFQNVDPIAQATVTLHLPDGTRKTAAFTPGELTVAEDLRNNGIGIGSQIPVGSTTPGPVYPFALADLSLLPAASMGPTPAAITGVPFVCANFNPLGASSCAPVALQTDLGNLLVDPQMGAVCVNGCPPSRGVFAAVTNPTLFINAGSNSGGKVTVIPTNQSCTGPCSLPVSFGQNTLLTAVPAPGFAFAGWSGACQASAPACNVTIRAPVTFAEAEFVPSAQPPIVASSISVSYSRGGCAITTTQAVYCWGPAGQSTVPVEAAGIPGGAVSIASGFEGFNCVVTQVGAVQCWGDNTFGEVGNGNQVPSVSPVTVLGLGSGAAQVAANFASACALTSAGAAVCWGSNSDGQLGNGSMTDSTVPVPVSGLSGGVLAITAGWYHACAALVSGGVDCWGRNLAGQLGNGTSTQSSVPVEVVGLTAPVTAVAGGASHTCALTSSGAVLCWGENSWGQLGNGSTTSSQVAVQVTGLTSGVVAIAAGAFHSCAVTASGTVKCWSSNVVGQLGNAATSSSTGGSEVPVDVVDRAGGITALAAGGNNTCALTNTGAVKCWGENGIYELGNGIPVLNSPTPVGAVGLGTSVVLLSAGLLHTCALTDRGAVQCWGDNPNGGLGNGTTTESSAPVAVGGLGGEVIEASAGQEHTCAVMSAGTVECWGYNGYAQLGNGSLVDSAVPVTVNGLTSVASLAAGGNHSCAVTTLGAVQCWGTNQFGELGDGTFSNATTPVLVTGLSSGAVAVGAGDSHSCAVSGSGAVECWGANSYGQLGNGLTSTTPVTSPVPVVGLTSGVQAIAAGSTHTCALTSIGGVECWGDNTYGQLGNGTNVASPTPVTVSGLAVGAVALSTSAYHSCALTFAGAVLCWGSNGQGQLGNGTQVNSSTPVAVQGLPPDVATVTAGGNHSCALTGAGMVLCWGDNANGQLGNGSTTSVSVPTPVTALASDNSLTLSVPPGAPASPIQVRAGSSPLSLVAVSSRGLAPTFSTFTPDRCVVSRNAVSFLAPGICMVQASQAGNGTYNPAPTQTSEIIVLPSSLQTAPVLVRASIAPASQVQLTWTESPNAAVSPVTGYQIWRSTNGATAAQIATVAGPNTLSYSDTSVVVGNTYAYTVTALNSAGASQPSNQLTVAFVAPQAPTGLTATVTIGGRGFDNVRLTWAADPGASSYTVTRASTATFTTGVSTTNNVRNTHLTQSVRRGTPGVTTYYYRITASNPLGVSPASAAVSVVTK